MSRRLVKKEINNTITYIDYELLKVFHWLSKYLVNYESGLKYEFVEIHYIAELIKYYKEGNTNINNLKKQINNDDEIKNDELSINIVNNIIANLTKILEENNNDILNNIKKIIYDVYLNEALRIIYFSDNEIDELNLLFNKAINLNISTELLIGDIGHNLMTNIWLKIDEDRFYEFIDQLCTILSLKEDIYETEEISRCYQNIEATILSLIGE